MNTNGIFAALVVFFMMSILHAQLKNAKSLDHIVKRLNQEIVPTLELSIEQDKAILAF